MQRATSTIMTGALANGLPKISVTDHRTPRRVFGGFLITGQYVMNAGTSGAPAYILDADGDYVWWYNIDSDVTGARMSYDGTHMWINGANVPNHGAHVHRVTMDGLTDEDSVQPVRRAEPPADGAARRDDRLLRLRHQRLRRHQGARADGTVKTIVNAQTAHGGTTGCHVNNDPVLARRTTRWCSPTSTTTTSPR